VEPEDEPATPPPVDDAAVVAPDVDELPEVAVALLELTPELVPPEPLELMMPVEEAVLHPQTAMKPAKANRKASSMIQTYGGCTTRRAGPRLIALVLHPPRPRATADVGRPRGDVKAQAL
jgi:hypothetical protein